ncbi:MAG: hypothetical protein AAF757_12675 [Cyanobacteria bacterium P01_D01_bin.116]
MHSTFCGAMLVLPVIGLNAVNGLQAFDSKESRITDFVTGAKIVQPYLTNFTPNQLSARDDRIKDCLRSGSCKN